MCQPVAHPTNILGSLMFVVEPWWLLPAMSAMLVLLSRTVTIPVSLLSPSQMCLMVPPHVLQVIAVSLFQCGMAYAVRNCGWGAIFALGWAVSGFCNQNLFCAQHELSHFLAYKKPLHNKILSIASNCPLVVPTATTFRKYHQEHHSHLVSFGSGGNRHL